MDAVGFVSVGTALGRRAPRALSTRTSARPLLHGRSSAVRMAKTEESTKQADSKEEDSEGFWQGEWICIDCGYVYGAGEEERFEDLPGSWRCPQCRAPKRRFAKKAGTVVGKGLGTSNLDILIWSLVGLAGTVLFGVWAAQNL